MRAGAAGAHTVEARRTLEALHLGPLRWKLAYRAGSAELALCLTLRISYYTVVQ
jgi:hypothetical protein